MAPRVQFFLSPRKVRVVSTRWHLLNVLRRWLDRLQAASVFVQFETSFTVDGVEHEDKFNSETSVGRTVVQAIWLRGAYHDEDFRAPN